MYPGSWVEENSVLLKYKKNSTPQELKNSSNNFENPIYRCTRQNLCHVFYLVQQCIIYSTTNLPTYLQDSIVLWLQHCWMNFVYIVYFTNVLLFLFVDILANVIEWFFFSLIFSFFNLKWSIRGKTNKGSVSFDDMKRLRWVHYKTLSWLS